MHVKNLVNVKSSELGLVELKMSIMNSDFIAIISMMIGHQVIDIKTFDCDVMCDLYKNIKLRMTVYLGL